jgi:peroxin-4
MASHRRLLKELSTSLDPTTLPDSIISLHPINENDLYHWTSVIHPSLTSNSLYADAYFQLIINIPISYPLEPPNIRFITHGSSIQDRKLISSKLPISTFIPHCNIDFNTGEVCIDILKQDNWSPAWTLQTAILAIIVLLDNQEPDSPLNVDMANLFRLNDKLAINSIIKYYLHKKI